MIEAIAFYLFAAVLIFSAIMVITARNPVLSVLFLILGFFNSAGLFVLLGAEFIAFIMVIVYVGAVAVLFLFVVMMLDISFSDLRKGAMQYVPIGLAIGAVLLAELFVLYGTWELGAVMSLGDGRLDGDDHIVREFKNTESIGIELYTQYVYAFQTAGLILLVAMIGAIVLTHRSRAGVRKQNVMAQQAMRPEDAMEIQKVTPKTGV